MSFEVGSQVVRNTSSKNYSSSCPGIWHYKHPKKIIEKQELILTVATAVVTENYINLRGSGKLNITVPEMRISITFALSKPQHDRLCYAWSAEKGQWAALTVTSNVIIWVTIWPAQKDHGVAGASSRKMR